MIKVVVVNNWPTKTLVVNHHNFKKMLAMLI